MAPEVPSDPSAALKRLAAGRADFAISYEPEVLIARSEGVPVVAVGALVTRPAERGDLRTDRISGPDDLEGKTIGAAGTPSDRPLLDAVVRDGGGDPSKVTVKNVGFNLSPALAAGTVDAVIGAYWNIELVDLERQDQPVEALKLDEHGVPTYDELVVVTSDTVARDKPELVRAFLRGLQKGQDWAATDQAGAVEHLLEANKDLDEDTVKAQLRETAPVLSPSDVPTLGVDPAQWTQFADWMTQNGLLTKPVDAIRRRDRPLPPRGPLTRPTRAVYQEQPGPQVRVIVGPSPCPSRACRSGRTASWWSKGVAGVAQAQSRRPRWRWWWRPGPSRRCSARPRGASRVIAE